MSIKDNISKIKSRLAQAAIRAKRNPNEIKLVAVIKNVPIEQIFQALEAGVSEIGENRIQEALGRAEQIKANFPQVVRHFVGHLQRNKVGHALDIFDIIQSLDSQRLASEIAKNAVNPVPVFIEVNTSQEAAKFGVEPKNALDFVRSVAVYKQLRVIGLMTIGPLVADPEAARSAFRQLKQVKEEINQAGIPGVELRDLSMGMTNDFEVAIEEGATMVRIGRGIFG